MSEYPFLDRDDHPSWSKLSSDRIKPEITIALERSEQNLSTIRNLEPGEHTFSNTIKAIEHATLDLNHAWGLVSHLDSVCNSKELRSAHNEMLPKVSAFWAKISLDAKLWNAVLSFSKTKEAKSLNPIDKRLLDETLADFRDEGADLPTR